MESSNRYLRQLLTEKYQWMEEKVFKGAASTGYGFVSPAMSRMFGYIRREPVSISELARKMTVSRQAIHKMVVEAVSLDLVELLEDPKDKRVKLVRFTKKGLDMSEAARTTIEEIEAELISSIGEDDYKNLKRILSIKW